MMSLPAHRFALRRIAAALLVLALLLPKTSGLLADLAPGLSRAVICTGQGIEIVIFDADGRPLRREIQSEAPCVLVDPAANAAPIVGDLIGAAALAAPDFSIKMNALLHAQQRALRRAPRAPPRLS